ncbi:hypothetical protein NDU88_006326 [Pleurodeles waltl]|uniref:Uncharacterized protein n=1 Tax=Pleurodeles waltl TaxID=8319 RepID=A0AAV7VMG4_PLEWA|nr:hypothetical protein NDU88_006326 [Pleurodeles waltl]
MDWRKRRESQTLISAQRADISNGRVEIQQDGTMAVVVPEMAVESTEPSDARMALILFAPGWCCLNGSAGWFGFVSEGRALNGGVPGTDQ